MKIIQLGTPRPKYEWMGQWAAPNECGTIVELTEIDVGTVEYDYDQRDGESVHIVCPACKRSHYFERYGGRDHETR